MRKYALIAFFFIGAVTMLVMSMHFFLHEVSGIMKYKAISSSLFYRTSFKAHIFFGLVAISTGPFQFLNHGKRAHLSWHRSMGYVYFVSVLISSVMGLGVAPFAMGGITSAVGFSLLALCWMSTAVLAIIFIRQKDYRAHKLWMFVNYGLTFAAITQRSLLLVPLLIDIEFITIYRLSAWLPWLLNTGIALYLFRRSEHKDLAKVIVS